MLGKKQIEKELCKNIYIYPMEYVVFCGASIDLSASRFAWTTDGKYIFDDEKNKIVIPPNKTALIYTNEVVHTTGKIGGTYHAKVCFSCKGANYMSTILDPDFYGPCIIAIRNDSENSFEIRLNSPLVSLIFDYIENPSKTSKQPTTLARFEIINGFEKADDFIHWYSINHWTSHFDDLKEKCLEDLKTQKMMKEGKGKIIEILEENIWKALVSVIFIIFAVWLIYKGIIPKDETAYVIFIPLIFTVALNVADSIWHKFKNN